MNQGTKWTFHPQGQSMTTSLTTQTRLPRNFKTISSPTQKTPYALQREYPLVIWVALIGIFFPPIPISVGSIIVTPGRFVVILFLVPALGILLKSRRNRLPSDFLAAALATWMIVSSVLNGGFRPYVCAEALEFLGAYLVGRAFVFGPSNLRTFVRAFRRITVVLIALALLDNLSGQYITLNSFGITNILAHRFGQVRAASVFEGAEHYGTFCIAAASIFFYLERGTSRILYVGLSFLGCALSLSSGPFLGLAIITAAFSYDSILKKHPWRWKAATIILGGFILSIFVFFDHPLERIITHLTLDPQTGYFRLGTWNAAMPLIDQSSFIGHGLVRLGDSPEAIVYLTSVDCIWLVEALRYGLTGVILLIMTMLASILSGRKTATVDPSMYNAQRGFSLAIVAMALIGLTVHFWDATWLLLNLCIGIRASFADYAAGQQASRIRSEDLYSNNLALAHRRRADR
jgi:hypothetical protein